MARSKASSLSSAEVRRLWEEPAEEIGLKSDSVGILAACGGEDVKQSDWRLTVDGSNARPMLCNCESAYGFWIPKSGFRSDAQSFAEPAPTPWRILNWLGVLAWGVTLLTTALGKGRLRLPLFLWCISVPLAAWIVIMMGYDY